MPITARAFIRSQLLFVGVGVLALAAIVAVALWLGARSDDLARGILEARDLKTTAVEVREAIQRAESSQRGFLYTNNEVYLAPYGLAQSEARQKAGSLPLAIGQYPNLRPVTDKLIEIVDTKFSEMDSTIQLAREGRAAEALDQVLTNRGKALTDEANVYLAGVEVAADGRLSDLVTEQAANAGSQRIVAVVGGLIAIAAAVAALLAIMRYAAELAQARDALATANAELEGRVARRTADLARSTEEMRAAKDRAELLLREVNHRVANSLAMVSSLVGMQANASKEEGAKAALSETQSRIQAIAMVHQRLYASGDVAVVALDEYLRSVLEQFQASMGSERRILLNYELDQLRMKTDASINLGVVAAEWVMNAAKYAYPSSGGEVRVLLKALPDGRALLAVEDNGVGKDSGPAKGTGLGSRIVGAMARSLSGTVEYVDRTPGVSARLVFPLVGA